MKDAKVVAHRGKVVSLRPYTYSDLLEAALLDLEDGERVMLREETSSQLQTLLRQLPPLQQQVIALRMVYNMRFKDIGERLHMPAATARSHASRAIYHLQDIIRQQLATNDGALTASDGSSWQQVYRRSFRELDDWLFSEEMAQEVGLHDWSGDDSGRKDAVLPLRFFLSSPPCSDISSEQGGEDSWIVFSIPRITNQWPYFRQFSGYRL